MSQVSQHRLNPQVSKQLSDTFLSAISRLTTPSSTQAFLQDLLSETEITMLAKRLSIAYMLRKGYTQRDICSILKVSLATVSKVNNTLNSQGDGYKLALNKMLKEEKITKFFDQLSAKIDHALPPRGANWSEHYKRTSKSHQAKKKAY